MYRKYTTFSAVLIAALTVTGLMTSPVTAQVEEAEKPAGDAPPAAQGAQDRDYTKIQASGLLATTQPVQSVAFSPDGRLLAALTISQVYLWDTTTGTALKPLTFPQAFVRAMCWLPDSRFLVTGGGGQGDSIKVWDVQTGTAVTAFAPRTFVSAIALSPDRSVIASTGFDKKIKLWNPGAGQEVRTLDGPQFPVSSLEFSADGQILYAIGGGTGKLLQAAEATAEGDIGPMPGMSPPGTYESMTEIVVWAVADGTRLQQVVLSEGSPSAALSPDKSLLAVVGSYGIQRALMAEVRGRMQTLYSNDTLRLWRVPQPNAEPVADPATAFLPNVLKIPNPSPKDKVALAWSPDGKVRAIDNFLWDGGATPTPLPRGNLNQYNAFAFSADGRFLAGGGANGVQIWVIP